MKATTSSILLAAAAASMQSASAFVPTASIRQSTIAIKGSDATPPPPVIEEEEGQVIPPSLGPTINGWTPDATKPCFGLPGVVAPTGYFDPLGFSQDGITLNEVKRYREAEVQHGRVAMLATLGYFVGEVFPGPFGLVGPANDQLQQLPIAVLVLFGAGIGYGELNRARIGWVEPNLSSWTTTLWTLRDNYYPGDVGFDPLNLKPSDPIAFNSMATREIQNGRLAMIGVAGMCSQELVNHRTIMETLNFYNKVYGGVNPYDGCADGLVC